jgi:hypothetical protein
MEGDQPNGPKNGICTPCPDWSHPLFGVLLAPGWPVFLYCGRGKGVPVVSWEGIEIIRANIAKVTEGLRIIVITIGKEMKRAGCNGPISTGSW